MLVLEKVFDNVFLWGIKIWWFDRRNKCGWWIFWIVFISLVLVILGGICLFILMIGMMMFFGEVRIVNDFVRINIDFVKINNDIVFVVVVVEKWDGFFFVYGIDLYSGCVVMIFSVILIVVLGV